MKITKQMKQNIIASIIGSLFTLLVVSIISAIKPGDVIHLFNGVTKSDMKEVIVDSPIIAAGTVEGGKTEKYNPNTEITVLKKEIQVNQEAIIIISAYAQGRLVSESDKNFGQVIAKIFINGKICSKDNSVVKGVMSSTLLSTCTCIKKLDPGEYTISAEGVFFGFIEKPDIDMHYVIIRNEGVNLVMDD